jgi:hypothetical protein
VVSGIGIDDMMRPEMPGSTGRVDAEGPGEDVRELDSTTDRPLLCATCGTPLGDDPEDEPDGDAGLPICGECNRARNFDLIRFGEEDS